MSQDKERQKRVMDALSRLMLSGWTMTAQACPVSGCNTPLLRNGDKLYCASCDAPIRTVSEAEATSYFTDPPPPPADAPAAASAPLKSEDRSAIASKLLGQKLLLGWRMLADACGVCGTPLMMPKGSDRTVCLLCSRGTPGPGPAAAASAAASPAAPAPAAVAVASSPPPATPGRSSALNHLRGRTDSEEDSEDAELTEDRIAARITEQCGEAWAEAFQEVRRGMDADAASARAASSTSAAAGSSVSSKLPSQQQQQQPQATPPVAATRAASGSQRRPNLSVADGNVGPSSTVELVSANFKVADPDPLRVAVLAAAMQRADEEEAAERAAAPTAAPPRASLPNAATHSSRAPPPAAPAQAAPTPTPTSSSESTTRAAARAASDSLAAQLLWEAGLIASLQRAAGGSAGSAGFATAGAIAESAERVSKIAAAITALRPLLLQ